MLPKMLILERNGATHTVKSASSSSLKLTTETAVSIRPTNCYTTTKKMTLQAAMDSNENRIISEAANNNNNNSLITYDGSRRDSNETINITSGRNPFTVKNSGPSSIDFPPAVTNSYSQFCRLSDKQYPDEHRSTFDTKYVTNWNRCSGLSSSSSSIEHVLSESPNLHYGMKKLEWSSSRQDSNDDSNGGMNRSVADYNNVNMNEEHATQSMMFTPLLPSEKIVDRRQSMSRSLSNNVRNSAAATENICSNDWSHGSCSRILSSNPSSSNRSSMTSQFCSITSDDALDVSCDGDGDNVTSIKTSVTPSMSDSGCCCDVVQGEGRHDRESIYSASYEEDEEEEERENVGVISKRRSAAAGSAAAAFKKQRMMTKVPAEEDNLHYVNDKDIDDNIVDTLETYRKKQVVVRKKIYGTEGIQDNSQSERDSLNYSHARRNLIDARYRAASTVPVSSTSGEYDFTDDDADDVTMIKKNSGVAERSGPYKGVGSNVLRQLAPVENTLLTSSNDFPKKCHLLDELDRPANSYSENPILLASNQEDYTRDKRRRLTSRITDVVDDLSDVIQTVTAEQGGRQYVDRISADLARSVTALVERKRLLAAIIGTPANQKSSVVSDEERGRRSVKRTMTRTKPDGECCSRPAPQGVLLEEKKLLLLAALAEAKRSLAAQAQRLQNAYDSVLASRWETIGHKTSVSNK